MEIIEIVVGSLELLAAWRFALTLAIGLVLGILILLWLGAGALGLILAGTVFLGSLLCGLYWQREFERGRAC